MNKRMIRRIIFSGIIFVSTMAGAATSLDAIRLNKEGAEYLKKQNFSMAERSFIKALTSSPFSAAVQLNLGLAYYGLGQMEKAQAAYEAAAKLADEDKLKFIANFNLGELHQKAKKVDEALHFYQEALKYEPDSRETKVNIELLIQDQNGGGKGDGKDDKDKKDNKGEGQSKDDKGEGKDDKDDKDDGKDKKEKSGVSKGQAPKPQFNSKELTQADVNKILAEINQQEQKIRADFNRKDAKEKPRGKDW